MFNIRFLINPLITAVSDICSEIISMAPSSACLGVSIPFSLFKYFEIISSLLPLPTRIVCASISFARGSSPFSFAIVAFVVFFGLKGK